MCDSKGYHWKSQKCGYFFAQNAQDAHNARSVCDIMILSEDGKTQVSFFIVFSSCHGGRLTSH